MKENNTLEILLEQVRACRACEAHLPLGPRPVLRIHPQAKILISGQAPGTKVHETGIPWNDLSGKRLREWLGVDAETFYDPTKFAVLPKGFCYPGKGTRGDLPPREECAQLWFSQLLSHMPGLKIILPIGIHSQAYFLKGKRKATMAETVAAYEDYLPQFLPLPHPSPRNIMWFRKHSWFEKDVVPKLRNNISSILAL